MRTYKGVKISTYDYYAGEYRYKHSMRVGKHRVDIDSRGAKPTRSEKKALLTTLITLIRDRHGEL